MKALEKSKVIITVGSGGVGKTTCASALGLYFAKLGQRVLVITVDPARRLLDAMAVSGQFDEPRRVHMPTLSEASTNKAGELFVFMPNLKKEWADFLESAIENTDVRRKIKANPFYQYMAEGMPGAFEIICSHVLFRLTKSGHYDKIILDTPPTSHSVSFFDVPKKISRVLEQGVFRALMSRRNSMFLSFTKKLAWFSGGILESTVERLIGSHFLSELIDFAVTIDELYEPMLRRVRAMDDLLKDQATKYALVVRPTHASIKDSAYLKQALSSRGIRIDQIIINQVIEKLDNAKLSGQRAQFKADADEKCFASVSRLVEQYVKEISCEQNMISDIKSIFPHAERRLLYLTNATMNRSDMLMSMVNDLSKESL